MTASTALGAAGRTAAVVFDFGGVLTAPVARSIAAWQERADIDPRSFSAALKKWLSRTAPLGTPIHRLETGELSATEFNRLLGAELRTRAGDPVPDAHHLHGIFAELAVEPAMISLVRDLRAAGRRTALLSNSWGVGYPRDLLAEIFDVVVISSEVGLRKPDPAIYRLVLDRLALAPGEVVFVDDAQVNVEAAQRIGMLGLLHADPMTTRRHVLPSKPNPHP